MTSHTKDHFDIVYINYLKQVQAKCAFDQQMMMATEQLIPRAKRQTAINNRQQPDSSETR